MASNKEITAEILAIDESAELDGLSNAQLAAKLKELKDARLAAKLKEAEAEAEAAYPFSVPKGCAVTTKRGIISGGEVNAQDFEGGEKTLNALVKSGHVVKA